MDRLQVKIEIDRLNQEIEELKAENARYRGALEFLKREYNGLVWRIADNALKGGE